MSHTVRRDLVRACGRLYARGLIAGGEGNVSLRLGNDRVLMTPRGVAKGELATQDLVEISLAGEHLRGERCASTESAVHLRIYRLRADVKAVIHAHPPTATGFATAGLTLPDDALPEVTFGLGPVALVPYARPGTERLADRVEEMLGGHDVLLLANHGAVAMGPNLPVALQRMESLEHAAHIVFVARLLGGPTRLTAEEVTALSEERLLMNAERARRPRRFAARSGRST